MQVFATGEAVTSPSFATGEAVKSPSSHRGGSCLNPVYSMWINALDRILFGALRFPSSSYLSTHGPQSFTYDSLTQQSGAHTHCRHLKILAT